LGCCQTAHALPADVLLSIAIATDILRESPVHFCSTGEKPAYRGIAGPPGGNGADVQRKPTEPPGSAKQVAYILRKRPSALFGWEMASAREARGNACERVHLEFICDIPAAGCAIVQIAKRERLALFYWRLIITTKIPILCSVDFWTKKTSIYVNGLN
jgi:hypothetical protein